MLSTVAISVCESRCTTCRGTDERLLPRVEALVGLELATLREGLGALWIVALVGALSCVGAEVGL